ncbi:hypothetical protein [Amycolatopsis lexingtonensis]|uniref:hypothetical protein n=1 Tax=Amycolatopsis lexingtonensis TaxID=218822 RepID=UPI003F72216F
MALWWGLAGLIGLLGCCGLIRAHVRADPLARYPSAREPARPNADAAHTPLMTPAITPAMLARRRPAAGVPAVPYESSAPESGSMSGEVPAPRVNSVREREKVPLSDGPGQRVPVVPHESSGRESAPELTPESGSISGEIPAPRVDPVREREKESAAAPTEEATEAPRRKRFVPRPTLQKLLTTAKRVLHRR